MPYETIKYEVADQILTITLNRPPMNPIHYELHNELARLWYQVQLDTECDVVILTGAGEVFSAGGDIPMMRLAGIPRSQGTLLPRFGDEGL